MVSIFFLYKRRFIQSVFLCREGLVRLSLDSLSLPVLMLHSSANDLYNLELTAAGTAFQAPTSSRSAFIALLLADQWMIFRNTVTDILHWDFVSTAVVLRFKSVKVRSFASLFLAELSVCLWPTSSTVYLCWT